jgi:hypothetical protein
MSQISYTTRLTVPHVADEQLEGGITNAGAVTRDGDQVVRPATANATSVHDFLTKIRSNGFIGVPASFGLDGDGRHRLEFVDGDVPSTPYPPWAQTDDALASVARLLRQFHDASGAFDPAPHQWNTTLADPRGGTIVCHNDVELSNVVFRDGVAVALIDLEFAAPGRPLYDLAHLARLCVPIDDDVDRQRAGWIDADRPARLRLAADAYGLDRAGRRELLSAIEDALDRIEYVARRSIANGDPKALAVVARTGGSEKYDRRREYWTTYHTEFDAALR